jgi:hypothetical protein
VKLISLREGESVDLGSYICTGIDYNSAGEGGMGDRRWDFVNEGEGEMERGRKMVLVGLRLWLSEWDIG